MTIVSYIVLNLILLIISLTMIKSWGIKLLPTFVSIFFLYCCAATFYDSDVELIQIKILCKKSSDIYNWSLTYIFSISSIRASRSLSSGSFFINLQKVHMLSVFLFSFYNKDRTASQLSDHNYEEDHS